MGTTNKKIVYKRCGKCYGVMYGELTGTGDKFCDCPTLGLAHIFPEQPEPKGWICPKCGSGVAPHTNICPCAEPLGIFPWDNGDNQQPCLHDQCRECAGTGRTIGGSICIHHLSCQCPKCSPTC